MKSETSRIPQVSAKIATYPATTGASPSVAAALVPKISSIAPPTRLPSTMTVARASW